jgi:archaetidylserine synthase
MRLRNDSVISSESILKLIKLPDLLSICNALLGFSAILLVLRGMSVTETALKSALVLILVAAFVDGLDGLVARNVECSPLGGYLDSLADMLSFGVATALVAYVLLSYYLYAAYMCVDVVAAFCGAYVVCGALRLARFDARQIERRQSGENKDFEGFPITGGAILLASFMFLTVELHPPPFTSYSLLLGLLGLLCFLMISKIRYTGIRDKRIAIPLGLVFLVFFLFYGLSLPVVYPAAIILALTVFYIAVPLLRLFKPL